MFTGIVAAVAAVEELVPRGEGALLSLRRPAGWDDVRIGESVCVSGVCLTVLPGEARGPLRFDLSPETLFRSTLGRLGRGSRVNLERAMRPSDRLGGHIVAGHVDATTPVLRATPSHDFRTLTFGLDASFSRFVVEKGSIALDGISLTVAGLSGSSFDVAVIPHTLVETTLGDRVPGDLVNVEADILGKYVERLLGAVSGPEGSRDARLRELLEGPP